MFVVIVKPTKLYESTSSLLSREVRCENFREPEVLANFIDKVNERYRLKIKGIKAIIRNINKACFGTPPSFNRTFAW